MTSFATIVAPATPPGEGGVGIVRLSGPDSVALLGRVFRARVSATEMTSHHLYYGHLCNFDEVRLDEVLAVVMRAPRSYTGEDVVEVHCHGGGQIMRSVLDLFLGFGARMAAPGEFTQRAFLNGRIDLTQAEAVIDLIRARSERAGRLALGQLDGHLSSRIHCFSDRLKESLALLEAHIDFPDDEVGPLDFPRLFQPLQALSGEMKDLVATFDYGRILREGITVLILGRPNVGKSSLLNALLGESRAIVTEVAGTTRDTLEESLVLAGFPLRLIDAAGVRNTEDRVEQEGIRRATEKAAIADLVLMVIDGSRPLCEEDSLVLSLCRPENTLLVINKSDQGQSGDLHELHSLTHRVSVSAKYGQGLTELTEAIVALLTGDKDVCSSESVIVTERRHRDALLGAVAALDGVLLADTKTVPLECLAMDLRESLSALGAITGETTPDEILEQIFSRFCIGK